MANNLSNISAHIPSDLAEKLQLVSEFEERPKSYYIKKGLTEILEEKFRDMQDHLNAKQTLADAKAKNEFVPFDEVFKDVE